MKTGIVLYQHSNIFYRQIGAGNKKIFCFHGYGESGETFAFLETALGLKYTLIAFDLPFHAQTVWKDGLNFTTDDLVNIINRFVDEDEKFYVLGYSMGGRIALHLFELIPQKIEQVVLIAPDGLHKNFWYYFSTQTFVGNKLFAYTMKHPAWLLGILKLGKLTGLINKSIFNFTHQYLDNAINREMLYKRWTTFRKIKPCIPHLKKIINENSVQIKMMFGKFDKIILAKNGVKFSTSHKDKIVITEIEAGHQLLRSKYAGEIARLFNS